MPETTNPAIERARTLLRIAGVFFYDSPSELDEGENIELLQTINMNDVWAWACADGEYVEGADLPELSRLFGQYGWCGILYWVSEKRGQMASEFADNNRFIEFVRNEEAIRTEIPSSTKRAYAKRTYTVGRNK